MEKSKPLLEESLFNIWNNRNPSERLSEMAHLYAPDIHSYESDDAEPFIGFENINDLISKIQSQWPPDFLFQAETEVQMNHHVQVASWQLGSPGQNPVAEGMDVAITKEGKITALYLYLKK